MKKTVLIFGILLISSLLCSCGEGKKEEGGEPTAYTQQIATFDTRDDFYNFWLDNSNSGTIGSVSLNRDKMYITQGDGSLKWEMEAANGSMWNGESYDVGSTMNACLKVYKNTNGDFADMRNVRYISVDCYNANEFEVIFGACVQCYVGDTYFSFDNATITVLPGEWGTLRIFLDRFDSDPFVMVANIPIFVDYAYQVAEEETEIVEKGDLYFPKGTVYLDNIYAVRDESETAAQKSFADEKELLYFDSIKDMEYVSTYMANGELSWNEREVKGGTGVSARYNTNPVYTNGRMGSLELRLDRVSKNCNNWNRQYIYNSAYSELQVGVEFKGFLDQVNFLPLKTDGYKIALDVYNGFDYDKEVYFGCDDAVHGYNYIRQEEYPYVVGKEAPLSTVYKLEKGKWTTIYFDQNDALDLSRGLVRIRLAASRTDVFETGCFYMNNLRLVKEGEE